MREYEVQIKLVLWSILRSEISSNSLSLALRTLATVSVRAENIDLKDISQSSRGN